MAVTKEVAEREAKKAAAVADAKASPGVNAGSDEVGSLGDVEDAQNDEPTAEPAAAYSSGFDADSVAKEQRAIKRQAEEMAKVNAEREAEAADEENVAASYKTRIETLERKLDAVTAYIVKKDEGRLSAGDLDKLKETD